ncbi:DUF4307 domain-containing protein [Leucobacter sp. CSA1]|uniref:DUF4307 domain-containing protein n=1 Tax=Leucobacter chromiisoli TaxID=2796471 RepID=A0A934Q4M3_9MICO|nr:DUF4307 domain-containing protein [Leucobacter chromiisoli]MBK0418335.1 DUF4307 domain-containing protein [Leucobacter chromiisoli]
MPETAAAPDEASRTLEERYGTRRQRGVDRRIAWTAVALLAIGGGAFLAFGGWQQGSAIGFQDIGRTIHGDGEVEVRFEVTAPAGTAVACAVEAQNASKATVGWSVVEVPASERHSSRVTTTLVTTNRAATGHVRDCWALEG